MLCKSQPGETIIRRKELEAKIGLGRSTVYNRIDPKSKNFDPAFPKPINLGTGLNPPIGWLLSEVEAWLATRIQSSRKGAK